MNVEARAIKITSIQRCPHGIWTPSHYRDDESCRCNDPGHNAMKHWGYVWDTEKGQWV